MKQKFVSFSFISITYFCKIRVCNLFLETQDIYNGCLMHLFIHREYVHSVVVCQKYLTRLGELIIFKPWREKYHFCKPS